MDANFLLVPLTLGIDLFQEIPRLTAIPVDLILLDAVRRELEELASSSGPKLRKQVTSSLETFGSKCREVSVPSHPGETIDDLLVRVALENHCLVATNDKDLRRRLRHSGIAVVFVRHNSVLELNGWVRERSNNLRRHPIRR